MKDSRLVEFIVYGLTMVAFFGGLKLAANNLPDTGIVGDIKKFIMLA